jgi:protein-tyrosine phosphatase
MRREYKVLMVCMGNICRSPTAEAVFRRLVAESELSDVVHIDSAGTLDHHAGSPPDHRAQQHARQRGYDLSGLRARQVTRHDFDRFDLLLAMDWQNHEELIAQCPLEHRHKVRRLMEFAPVGGLDEVPDPYYGGAAGFERVLDQVEEACRGLLVYVRTQLP